MWHVTGASSYELLIIVLGCLAKKHWLATPAWSHIHVHVCGGKQSAFLRMCAIYNHVSGKLFFCSVCQSSRASSMNCERLGRTWVVIFLLSAWRWPLELFLLERSSGESHRHENKPVRNNGNKNKVWHRMIFTSSLVTDCHSFSDPFAFAAWRTLCRPLIFGCC